MIRRLLSLVALLAVAAAPAPPVLLVVGVPHFDNPGLDISNTKIEDVLTQRRQREIVALVARLARFKPDHVAVEWPTKDQAGLDKRYADYRAGRLKIGRDEVDQIGLRLAALLNLPRVEAADWNEDVPGPDSFYAFDDWAKKNGRWADYEAYQRGFQAKLDAATVRNRCLPVSDWLRAYNGPAFTVPNEASYFFIAQLGGPLENPGAAWVGSWHARNLRIAANLRRITKPGERTLAIFGAGHAALLREYGAGMGFTVADTLAALPPASRPRC